VLKKGKVYILKDEELLTRKDVILVVCNRLSKMTHFVATIEGTSAEGLARLFRDNV